MPNFSILGLSHELGWAVVDRLVQIDQPATVLVSNPTYIRSLFPEHSSENITLIKGDMDNHDAVANVCEDADIIIPLFTLPFAEWDTTMIRWISKTSDLGAALGAKIIYPSTVSPYGRVPNEQQPVSEEYPKKPKYKLGQLRLSFENRLIRGSYEGASLSILRFPHIYGEGVLNPVMFNVFANILNETDVLWYGDPELESDFIYSRDAGTTIVNSAFNQNSADDIFHVTGPSAISAKVWITQIMNLAGKDVEISVRPKWRLYLSSFFNSQWREVIEQYHHFDHPVLMSDSKFQQSSISIQYTDHEDGIKNTLKWYSYWLDQ